MGTDFPPVRRGRVKDQETSLVLEKVVTAIEALFKFLRPLAQPEPWKDITLATGWATYTTALDQTVPQYRKTPLGLVELRGTVAGAGDPLTQLPEGYRPTKVHNFPVPGNSAFAVVAVEEDGKVRLVTGLGGTKLSLDSIRFEVT